MKPDFPNNVVIVGLGYVGLPLALLAARRGYVVTGLETNTEKVVAINERRSPFADERLTEELVDTTLTATTDVSVLKHADIIVVCVPTPVHHDFEPDLGPVIGAAQTIGKFLKSGQLVVLESTVNPGVCEDVLIPELEKSSNLVAGRDFYVAHCPERINPGDPTWTVTNIPRVVGSFCKPGLETALMFYRSLVDADIRPMGSLKEAEAVKIVENSFRDVNIAFVNELAMSFSHLGIDVVRVIEGAASKPFAFMPHFPGCGVGGHCIPVDPYYLIKYAKQNGFDHDFLSLARKINNGMPDFTVGLLLAKLKEKGIDPVGAKVAVLGLAYKPNLDDDRESPAYEIIESMKSHGINVVAFDPYIQGADGETLENVLIGAKAAVVATAHKEFAEMLPTHFSEHGIEIIIDGRNCLNKEAFVLSGASYQGIGR
jgi:nucleotide sugar dehydrogenase